MKLFRLLSATLACLAAPALASEIALAPLRQVLTAESPKATFRLTNPTDRILEARVSWIDLAATAEGYARATPKQRAQISAAPFLILRPAFVRLEPGRDAEIEVSLKPGMKIPPGERRSHMLIEIDAQRSPLRRIGGLEVDIGLAVSAPVLLRGKGEAAATIGNTRFGRTPDGLLEVVAAVEPQGAHSAYGRLVATFASAEGKREVGETRNVAAFPDAKERRVNVRLDTARLPAGVLTLDYVGEGEFEGRVFASRRFTVEAPHDAR